MDNGEELLKGKQVDALEILLIHRFERRRRMVPPEYRKMQPQSPRNRFYSLRLGDLLEVMESMIISKLQIRYSPPVDFRISDLESTWDTSSQRRPH